MSSKADDFDVRYRDVGTAGHGRSAADGGYRGNAGDVDYDLGYDAEGWDTQGFRRPEADYLDSHDAGGTGAGAGNGAGSGSTGSGSASSIGGVGTAVRPDLGRPLRGRPLRGRRDGSHARAAGTEQTGQLGWESEATGALWAPEAPGRGPWRVPAGRGDREARGASADRGAAG